MTISRNGLLLDGVPCDVLCTGRFYDFFEQREGRWGRVHRQPIYEKDRVDPIDPAARLQLDQAALTAFPEGYRHLACIQARIGYTVRLDMPMLTAAMPASAPDSAMVRLMFTGVWPSTGNHSLRRGNQALFSNWRLMRMMVLPWSRNRRSISNDDSASCGVFRCSQT